MRRRTFALRGVVILALGLGGCSRTDLPATPLSPSPMLPRAVAPVPPSGAATLRNVSLSGVVYELTPTGRRPIPQAYVYCEACSEQTHQFVLADENGFYRFSGDLASGGGVWLTPGDPTEIYVGTSYNKDFEDPPGVTRSLRGPGWRAVMIDGDTSFDIELVRRIAASR